VKLSDLAKNVAQSTQAAVAEWVQEYGRQRGLMKFAIRIGVTERRARSLLEGTAGRIDAAEYIAAQEARAEIIRLRLARAQHDLEEIEGGHHGLDLVAPWRGMSAHGRGVYLAGGLVPGARGEGPVT